MKGALKIAPFIGMQDMNEREQRGLVIAAVAKIKRKGGVWLVPAQTGRGHYTVCPDGEQPHCSCADHETRGVICKHIYAARIVIQRELFEDGTEIETRQVTVTETRQTYPQNWTAYNRAQTSEKGVLQDLLYDLCQSIPEATEHRLGRPRLPLRDGIFSACFKVYSQLSSRRFATDLREAHERGYISRVPHFNPVLRVFDSEETTPILTELVAKSAEPLAAIETSFAIDSTGFSGCRFDRWYAKKWQNAEPITRRAWVKAHACIGTTTNVVTAVKILDSDSGDVPQFVPLLHETAERFTIQEVSADKAYLAEPILHAVDAIGARAYIPFKSNSIATRPGVWNNAYHYFNLHREQFLAHYHKRSNVESTFSMIKRKFGDSVRAKNDTSMRNEALAKFVCHNLCCLIQSMNEFGIDPTFGCTKSDAAAPNLRAI
jgi:transposase